MPPSDWIENRPVPLDFGGPADVPYEPLSDSSAAILGLQAVERAASLDPAKTAIFDGEISLTYADLLDRTYGLAHRLAAQLPAGSAVVSLVYGNAAAPVIILACAAAGLTLIPIDAGHPVERAAAIFDESGATAVILASGDDVDDSYIPAGVPRISVDITKTTYADRYISRPIAPNAPMMVIFTSGSTGRPKGVVYGSEDGVNAMRRFVESFHINRSDVIISLSSLSTGGMRDAFAALTTGATIRIADIKRSGASEVLRIMGSEGITILSFVPTVLRTLMKIPNVERAFAHLRALDLHGEATLASDIALFRSKLSPGCHISITLGATETGTMLSWFVDEQRFEGGAVPVGYLCPGKAIAIIAENGAAAGPGEPGEMLVRGELALGSWQKGRLTEHRFLRDPIHPAIRVYQTGDLVRMRADGLVEYLGRKDRQAKIRGLWADLGEVEAALRSVDGITDAVVIVRTRDGEGDALVAFVTLDRPIDQLAELARETVMTATAEHMAPAAIHVLAQIPRLANYKPDLVRLDQLSKAAAARHQGS
jgi:acyl-coenzyme A synthetase/AMP-(fatty) acid ligase